MSVMWLAACLVVHAVGPGSPGGKVLSAVALLVVALMPWFCRYMCEGLYNWLATTLSRANNFVVEYDMLPSESVYCRQLSVSK